ncbi:MAG: hypothetical protein PIR02_12645 [Microbacterium enclense]
MAVAAVERALQVVVMNALPLARGTNRDDFLNTAEQISINERVMAAGVDVALEPREAQIVRVLEESK